VIFVIYRDRAFPCCGIVIIFAAFIGCDRVLLVLSCCGLGGRKGIGRKTMLMAGGD